MFKIDKDATKVALKPNKRQGCTKLNVKVLESFPGIPLNQEGMRFNDQSGGGFDDYDHIELEFQYESGESNLIWTKSTFTHPQSIVATEFVELFQKLVNQWKTRCTPFERRKSTERNARTTTSWKLTVR